MKKYSYRLMSLLLTLSLVILPCFGTPFAVKASAASYEANPSLMFTSIDEEMVSTTAASGQPTVIVFGMTTCGNTQGTLKDISNSSWISTGEIRVIFAEISKKTLDETKAFKNLCGCDDIIFCYDEYGFTLNNAWNEYCYLSPSIGAMPTTVIIDGNNQILDILSGRQSANNIINIINGNSTDNKPDGDETNPADSVKVTIEGTENYDYVNEVLNLVNQERAKKGVAALKLDESLLETAMQRAAELSLYYSHTRPDGSTCFTASSRSTRRSENIAAGYKTPSSVMNGWVNSSGHYANIMDEDVTSIGIGCFIDSSGIYNWVQFFDNDAAVEPSVSGKKSTKREISIQKNKLHLYTEEKQDFSSADANKEVKMDIYNLNEESNNQKTELPSYNFNFTYTGDAVSEINENGIIKLGDSGSATVTASLKSDDSITINRTITIDGGSGSSGTDPNPTVTQTPDATPTPGPLASYPVYIETTPAPTTATPTSTPATPSPIPATPTPAPVTPSPTAVTTTPPVTAAPSPVTTATPEPSVPTQAPSDVTPEPEEPVVPDVDSLKASTGTNNVKLTWKEATGVNGYIIYQYNNAKKTWNNIGITDTISYDIKKLTAGTSYRFAVKAYILHNDKEYTSKSYTSVYTATKPKSTNFNITAGKKEATLKWNKVKGADGYTVYYKNNKKDSWKKLKNTKNTSYTAKNLKSGKTYYFTVKAYKNYKGKTYTGNGSTKKVKIK